MVSRMESARDTLNVLICFYLTLVSVQGFSACVISSSYQGAWELHTTQNGQTFEHAYDITIMSGGIIGFNLDAFPNLIFECYSTNGNYITLRSEATKLFDEFDVRIFMCWYMYRVNSETYNIIELTNPVVVGSDDHAKAFLGTDSLPATYKLCDDSYNWRMAFNPPYKQLKKINTISWS